MANPISIAFDSFGNAWIGNRGGSSITEISSSGGTLTNYAPVAGVTSAIRLAVSPH